MKHTASCLLAAWAIFVLPAVAADEQRVRYAIDTALVCRDSPDLKSRAGSPIRLRAAVLYTLQVQVGPDNWYSAFQYVSGLRPSCWVFGPATVPDPPDTESFWLAAIQRVMTRTDAKLIDHVAIEIALPEQLRTTPLLRFRSLQMIAHAARTIEGVGNPLEEFWARTHSDLLRYYEPAAAWLPLPTPYLELLDRVPAEWWSDELAWNAASIHSGHDECYSDCLLEYLARGIAPYWSHFPKGKYLSQAFALALPITLSARRLACDPNDHPPAPGITDEIRNSLANVTSTAKQAILRDLDELDRKCAR